MIGAGVVAVVGGLLFSRIEGSFQYKETLKDNAQEVTKIRIDTDVADIKVTSEGSELQVTFKGNKPFFKNPSLKVTNNDGEVEIKGIIGKWLNIIPGTHSKGEMIINIPPNIVQSVQIHTGVGNIHLEDMTGLDELTLASNVGRIQLDSFKGNRLNINAKNGSIELGEIDGEVHVKNRIGKIKVAKLLTIKGESTIASGNGTIKLTLPSDENGLGYGLNLETKNGKIKDESMKLPKDSIQKQSTGQKLNTRPEETNKLSISVSVGNIELY